MKVTDVFLELLLVPTESFYEAGIVLCSTDIQNVSFGRHAPPKKVLF